MNFLQIHVFTTHVSPLRIVELEGLLSPAELARAGRFQFEADRARYVASHGVLRTILGECLGIDPASVPLGVGIHRKPTIQSRGGRGVHFNMSRARDLCLIAVGEGSELGVDIESVRPLDDALSIAKSRFTPTEVASMISPESFFTLWTRKEAVVKCLGWGLALPFDVFEVAGSGVEPERVAVNYQGERSVHWLQPVPLGEAGYVAAIANAGEEPVSLRGLDALGGHR